MYDMVGSDPYRPQSGSA